MKTVGIRELKNRLSTYVRHVQTGEAVAVTDRGEIVAELTPPRRERDAAAGLAALAHKGELTPAEPCKRRKREALYPELPRVSHGDRLAQLLDAERGEH
jgi:prevent-host-death family protein